MNESSSRIKNENIISSSRETKLVDFSVSCDLSSNLYEWLEENILKNDLVHIFNEEIIFLDAKNLFCMLMSNIKSTSFY